MVIQQTRATVIEVQMTICELANGTFRLTRMPDAAAHFFTRGDCLPRLISKVLYHDFRQRATGIFFSLQGVFLLLPHRAIACAKN
jgi:hypothetical protein